MPHWYTGRTESSAPPTAIQGALKVLGVTALVWLGLTLLGAVVYGLNHGPPATPVWVDNRTGREIEVRLLGRGCAGSENRAAPGERARLSARKSALGGCHVLVTDAESGAFVALRPVPSIRSGLVDPIVVGRP